MHDDPLRTHYYATLDISAIARARHGPAFADWMQTNHAPIDFVLRLDKNESPPGSAGEAVEV